MKRFWTLWLITFFIFSCKESTVKNENTFLNLKLEDSSIVTFAKRFSLIQKPDYSVIYYKSLAESDDTTSIFILYKQQKPQLPYTKNVVFIKTPCKRIASLSTIYTSMFSALQALPNVVAIENIDYYVNTEVNDMFKKNLLEQVQQGPEINKEKLLKLNPDIVFGFGMGRPGEFPDKKITDAGIPFVLCIDHLEETPLARAEWIKFFAAFVNKTKEADSIFNKVMANYEAIQKRAAAFKYNPTVFTELKYGDTWYVPGGKSYMAKLIKDAHACYIWQNDSSSGSFPLSFEQVYQKAHEADYWLNPSMCNSMQEVLQQDKRYAKFKAFKQGNIYNHTRHINSFKYSAFWETGMIYPDKILNDLVKIFHPQEFTSSDTIMYYYKKLN